MHEYVSRPVKIHAIQWNGQNTAEVGEFIHSHGGNINTARFFGTDAWVNTGLGKAWLQLNDYLCIDNEGGFYPCKRSVFEHKYILEKSE